MTLLAIELKGGKRANISEAIEQLQGGLDLADSLLDGATVSSWKALLYYSGGGPASEWTVLRTVPVQYKGQKKLMDHVDCGPPIPNAL